MNQRNNNRKFNVNSTSHLFLYSNAFSCFWRIQVLTGCTYCKFTMSRWSRMVVLYFLIELMVVLIVHMSYVNENFTQTKYRKSNKSGDNLEWTPIVLPERRTEFTLCKPPVGNDDYAKEVRFQVILIKFSIICGC